MKRTLRQNAGALRCHHGNSPRHTGMRPSVDAEPLARPVACGGPHSAPLQGTGRASARYCQAHADRDADLTHLLMREVFPADQVEVVAFRSVGWLWRVEVGITSEESEAERERFAHRTDQAVRELEMLLQVGTDVIGPSGPGQRPGATAQ
jgi:hypothetical protein